MGKFLLTSLLSRIGFIWLLLGLSRWLLYAINTDNYEGIDASIFAHLLLYGARFDVATVIYYNAIFIFCSLIIFLFDIQKKWLNNVLKYVYLCTNMFVLLAQILGILYFKFNHRWTSIQDLGAVWESAALIYTICKPAIAVLIVSLLFAIGLNYFYKKTVFTPIHIPFPQRLPRVIFYLFVSVCLARGIGEHTLTPNSAAQFVPIQYTALIQNNPFAFLYSIYRPSEKLPYKHYFDESTAANNYPLQHICRDTAAFSNKNVVIFIMESMSREFLDDVYTPRPATPFLDSLQKSSWVFSNAFASGLDSPDGFSAIIGGLPKLTRHDYAVSQYNTNKRRTLPNILEKKGYYTSFFIGCNDFGYGMQKSAALYGIKHCFGRSDFNDETQADGSYGIYDHAFFPFALRKINQQPQPFFTTIFSIQTHYPFNALPKWAFKKAVPNLPHSAAVSYYDDVIRRFFKDAQKEKWFKNTIFVFVADHYSRSPDQQELSPLGIYKIPLFMYAPDGSILPEVYTKVAQQIDIPPTLLGLLHFSGKIACFGNDLSKKTTKQQYTYNRSETLYQIADDSLVLQYDHTNEKASALFRYKKDSNMQKNLLGLPQYKTQTDTLLHALRTRIQQFNNTLINNTLINNTLDSF